MIIFHSAIRPRDDKDPNNHFDIFSGVEADKPIKSVIKSKEYVLPDVRTITLSPDDLVGRTFLKQPKEDEQRFWARIVRKIVEMEENEEKIKFLVELPDEEQDEIMAYNDIIDIIANQYDDELNNPKESGCLSVLQPTRVR